MADTMNNPIFQSMSQQASDLAEAGSESFVLAVTAAYLAGKTAGQLVALKTNPPAA